MREVAARAGVSLATVSFVVNGTKNVSPATRRRVTAAMDELGYRHNVVARALASRRTRIVALLFPAVAERLSGIALGMFLAAASRASELVYHLVLWPTGPDGDDLGDLVASGLADGVVVMEVQLEDRRVATLRHLDVPFVSLGRPADLDGLPYVDMDFAATVEVALDHLVGLGHVRTALVLEDFSRGPLVGYGPSVRTEEAYRAGVAARGIAGTVVPTEPTIPGGRAAADAVLAADPDVTAVLVLQDDAAAGLLAGLASAGRRVPGDVSVISLASSRAAGARTEPALSTLDAPGEELARLAVEALVDRLDGRGDGLVQVLLPCVLHDAGSTAAARARA